MYSLLYPKKHIHRAKEICHIFTPDPNIFYLKGLLKYYLAQQ